MSVPDDYSSSNNRVSHPSNHHNMANKVPESTLSTLDATSDDDIEVNFEPGNVAPYHTQEPDHQCGAASDLFGEFNPNDIESNNPENCFDLENVDEIALAYSLIGGNYTMVPESSDPEDQTLDGNTIISDQADNIAQPSVRIPEIQSVAGSFSGDLDANKVPAESIPEAHIYVDDTTNSNPDGNNNHDDKMDPATRLAMDPDNNIRLLTEESMNKVLQTRYCPSPGEFDFSQYCPTPIPSFFANNSPNLVPRYQLELQYYRSYHGHIQQRSRAGSQKRPLSFLRGYHNPLPTDDFQEEHNEIFPPVKRIRLDSTVISTLSESQPQYVHNSEQVTTNGRWLRQHTAQIGMSSTTRLPKDPINQDLANGNGSFAHYYDLHPYYSPQTSSNYARQAETGNGSNQDINLQRSPSPFQNNNSFCRASYTNHVVRY